MEQPVISLAIGARSLFSCLAQRNHTLRSFNLFIRLPSLSAKEARAHRRFTCKSFNTIQRLDLLSRSFLVAVVRSHFDSGGPSAILLFL